MSGIIWVGSMKELSITRMTWPRASESSERLDALEKCSTNMAEKIEKKAIDVREEVQSNGVKYRDDLDGKNTDMVNRLQTQHAD